MPIVFRGLVFEMSAVFMQLNEPSYNTNIIYESQKLNGSYIGHYNFMPMVQLVILFESMAG